MNLTARRQFLALQWAIFLVLLFGSERFALPAESSRFLVSYGGTAGYQLPLWVNKELGFSKKYGTDLEIILIQAGSPNIQALLGGSLQLTQTAASSGAHSTGAARRRTMHLSRSSSGKRDIHNINSISTALR